MQPHIHTHKVDTCISTVKYPPTHANSRKGSHHQVVEHECIALLRLVCDMALGARGEGALGRLAQLKEGGGGAEHGFMLREGGAEGGGTWQSLPWLHALSPTPECTHVPTLPPFLARRMPPFPTSGCIQMPHPFLPPQPAFPHTHLWMYPAIAAGEGCLTALLGCCGGGGGVHTFGDTVPNPSPCPMRVLIKITLGEYQI